MDFVLCDHFILQPNMFAHWLHPGLPYFFVLTYNYHVTNAWNVNVIATFFSFPLHIICLTSNNRTIIIGNKQLSTILCSTAG